MGTDEDTIADFDLEAADSVAVETPMQDTPAAVVAEAPPTSVPQVKQDNPDLIPSWRLREEAEQRRSLERRVAEYEAAEKARKEADAGKEGPAIWDDPDAYVQSGIKQAVDPIQQQMRTVITDMSRRFAEQQHGADKVKAAYQAAVEARDRGEPSALMLDQRLGSSNDPFGDVLEWHNRQSVYTETGGNLEAYRNRIHEEALKDPAFLAKAMEAARANAQPGRIQAAQKPKSVSMPSLNRATGAAGNDDEPTDLDDVLEGPMRGRR